MRKPRVARIVSYLPVGGVEKRLLAILGRLKEDFEVEVICIHSRGKLAPLFEEANIPVTVIPFKSRLHPVSLYRLASYLRKRKVDIVHTHMYRPNISGTLAARLAGVPVVISNVHNVDHWDTGRQILMDRLLHPLRHGIVAVSQAVKRDIVNRSGAPLDKVVVIYNGLDLDSLQTGEEALERVKKEVGASNETFVVSMVARLVPAKGHEHLFIAGQGLERLVKNLQVLVVGGGSYKAELEERVRNLGLKKVRFLGERRDVPYLLKASKVSVLPSMKEGFSNVVLESMAARVPVVASDVGGVREAIEPCYSGFVVNYGAHRELEKVLLLLHSLPALRKSVGAHGGRRVERRFTVEVMAEKTKELYLNLLGRGR